MRITRQQRGAVFARGRVHARGGYRESIGVTQGRRGQRGRGVERRDDAPLRECEHSDESLQGKLLAPEPGGSGLDLPLGCMRDSAGWRSLVAASVDRSFPPHLSTRVATRMMPRASRLKWRCAAH